MNKTLNYKNSNSPKANLAISLWSKLSKQYKHQCRRLIADLYCSLSNVLVRNAATDLERIGPSVKYYYNALSKKYSWRWEDLLGILNKNSDKFSGIIRFSGSMSGVVHNLYIALVAHSVKSPAPFNKKFKNLYILLNAVIRYEASHGTCLSLTMAIDYLKTKVNNIRSYLQRVYRYMVTTHWGLEENPFDNFDLLSHTIRAINLVKEYYYTKFENNNNYYSSPFVNFYLSARYYIFIDGDSSVNSINELLGELVSIKINLDRGHYP